MSYTNTTKQFESDFGYYWLSKFTQVVLAIIPGLFFGYFYPILFQNPLGFSILAAFCLIISFAIHEFVGKKIYAKDEPHIPRYLAYILGFLAINILNFNNVNALSANLILTTVIVLQSVFIENFIFLTVALVLSYLTHIFYIFLPQSARFSDTVSSSSSVELIFLVVLFTLFNYAFYRLQNIKEMEEAEHKDEIDVIREIAFRKKINNVGAVINTLVFGLLFGYTLAGADTYLWGLVTVLLGLISLVIGWFYYHRFSIKSFSIIWFLLFGFY
ncbi:MAG: hypothetical protein NT135_00395, partial [Candidatus Berkelbacteria bacterium]|nr:hypothetical protein [Candidatus Berkelbacteria bacterium]